MKTFFADYHYPCRRKARENGLAFRDYVALLEERQQRWVEEWRKSNGVPPNPTPEILARFNERMETDHVEQQPLPRLATLVFYAELMMLEGRGIHYFVETEGLCNFLIRSSERADQSWLSALISPGDCFEDAEITTGIIHTTGKEALAVLFYLGSWKDKSKAAGLAVDAFVTFGRDNGLTLKNNHLEWRGFSAQELLVLGLGAYIKCFPHAVRNGFPDCAKHPAHYAGERTVSLTAVPEILHSDRNGPHGHYRNGHFRFLGSEFYSRKRGQWTWVSDTFVKGTAKTIEDVRCK
jgi:hypothetical protein